EKAKQIEQEKAAAAEKARLAEQDKVPIAAETAKQAEQEKALAAEKKQQLAALAPPAERSEQPAVDLPRALQTELRPVACNSGAVDGYWNTAAQKALDLFNKHAGLKLDVKGAGADARAAVKGKTG